MKKMIVNTNFGYIKDSEDKIVCKCKLPKGEHPLKDGYIYTEVNTIEELDNIEVYAAPKSNEVLLEEKIRAEIRLLAIESLRTKGKITEDIC